MSRVVAGAPGRRVFRLGGLLGAIAIGAIAEPRSASAHACFIQDGDVAALIAAINAANSHPGPDTIHLAPHGTYMLKAPDPQGGPLGPTGLPAIISSITIDGHGATIQRSADAGTPDFRILVVEAGADLTLRKVTIRNGKTGGGISPDQDCAGIFMRLGGKLTLVKSVITDNHSGFIGGGVCNDGLLLVRGGSVISHNSATDGGGIFNGRYGQLEAESSFIVDNSASFGGGIFADNGANTHLVATVLASNEAAAWGGGVSNTAFGVPDFGGVLTIEHSFILDNTAAQGGGIYNNIGTAEVTGSLIAGNTATSSQGSGIGNFFSGLLVAHDNCIVGNAPSAVFNAPSSPLLDARFNWWGAPSGPSGAGPGSGDSVSTNVEFIPFLTEPAFACDSDGDCDP